MKYGTSEMEKIGIEQIVNGLLKTRRHHLSQLAREGYGKQGRGAILLEMYIDEIDAEPAASVQKVEVDVYLVGYQSYQELSKLDLDRPFYHLLEDYDPFACGVIAFGANTSPRRHGGFFWFKLATKADHRVH
jgi:hypothetical protein